MTRSTTERELPSGALLVCWFSGAHEEDRSVRILCSRGSNDGARWSTPWTAVAPGDKAIGAAAPDKSLGNVTLTVTPGGCPTTSPDGGDAGDAASDAADE